MAELPLFFPHSEAKRLEPHLPPVPTSASTLEPSPSSSLPHVTLTFATSLDSALSLGPGIRTALSGPQSKAMTHYLRSRHDAICVGVGTAIADDPALNCRLATDMSSSEGGNQGKETGSVITDRQPRPVVIDPHLRWDFTPESKVIRLAQSGKGLAPYIITLNPEPPAGKKQVLEDVGGKFIYLPAASTQSSGAQRFGWHEILSAVRSEGLNSIMIEGGGEVINSLLAVGNKGLVDSVILTIAPTWLGQGGVVVSPPRTAGVHGAATRLTNIMWMPLGEDVVLCGRLA
ncbi:dihydrofolate reductase-like domain-containing protein [Xylariaceae sp. FL1272]|nr:dihydrofolate reductase-like domain-containing protein [Xylariaceae sp. FL1272]